MAPDGVFDIKEAETIFVLCPIDLVVLFCAKLLLGMWGSSRLNPCSLLLMSIWFGQYGRERLN